MLPLPEVVIEELIVMSPLLVCSVRSLLFESVNAAPLLSVSVFVACSIMFAFSEFSTKSVTVSIPPGLSA